MSIKRLVEEGDRMKHETRAPRDISMSHYHWRTPDSVSARMRRARRVPCIANYATRPDQTCKRKLARVMGVCFWTLSKGVQFGGQKESTASPGKLADAGTKTKRDIGRVAELPGDYCTHIQVEMEEVA